MANPTLNWRYVGVQTFVSLISNAHDALYALGTAATYADGSPRTPGTGSAWTWNREVSGVTVAVYGAPPVNALGFTYILGGTIGASAYTVLTPNSAAYSNGIVMGMNRSSGAYTTWTSATPFTNAGFSGFWSGTRLFATLAYDSVSLWESQEGCIIQWGNAAAGTTSSVGLGALVDPLSTAPLNAESDGRLYMMWGTGVNLVTPATFLNTNANTDGNAWGAGSSALTATHSGVFAPGTNVMIGGAGVQTFRFGSFLPTATFTSPNGDIARVPVSIFNPQATFIGQSRQWFITKDSTSRLTWTNGATVVGYIWATTLNTSTDAIVMTY